MIFKLLLNITWNSKLFNYLITISDHNCGYVTTAKNIYFQHLAQQISIDLKHYHHIHIYIMLSYSLQFNTIWNITLLHYYYSLCLSSLLYLAASLPRGFVFIARSEIYQQGSKYLLSGKHITLI